jgi:hypothetical protein
MKDEAYRVGCVDPVCELVKYMGKKMAEGDPVGWFNKLSLENQQFVTSAPIYDYVEIIP